MQHGTSYSSTHSFKTLHFLFESRLNNIGGSSRLYFKGLKRLPKVKRVTYAVIQ